ncbi:MAG: hypothetical protein K2X82_03170 [Gemmataceae bacterium]|nr:hypothetical protein [Gemmataceae bacterium]
MAPRLFVLGFTLAVTTPAGAADPPALDPPAARAVLQSRHPWAAAARSLADQPKPPYDDAGQWSCLRWMATGEARYARDAAARGLARLKGVGGPGTGRNATRESAILMVRMYAGLKGAFTPDEEAAWRAELGRWADLMLDRGPVPWGTRTGDSDEAVGHYFGLALIDKYLGTDYLNGTWRNGRGAPEGPVSRMRDAVRRFCKLARGGDWIESGWEYNAGTLQLLFLGALWAGPEQYPEVVALAPEAADWLMWSLAPDGRSQAGWGDCEAGYRRAYPRTAWVSLLGVLAGGYADALGPERVANVRRLVRDLTKGIAPQSYPNGYWITLYRPLMVGFDPRPGDADAAPYAAPVGLRAAGSGSVVHRGRDHLLHVFSQPPVGIDHSTAAVGEVRLRVGGVDVVDHLIGYGVDAVRGGAKNSPLAYGLPVLADRGVASAEATAEGGCRVVCRTAGPPYRGTWNPPPDFGSVERRVEGSADGRRVVVTDAFALSPPPPHPKTGKAYIGRDKDAAAAALDDPAGVRAAQTSWWVRGPYTLRAADGVTTLAYRAGGVPVTIAVSGHGRTAEEPADALYPAKGGVFAQDELAGAVRVGFISADPKATIRSEITVVDPPAGKPK